MIDQDSHGFPTVDRCSDRDRPSAAAAKSLRLLDYWSFGCLGQRCVNGGIVTASSLVKVKQVVVGPSTESLRRSRLHHGTVQAVARCIAVIDQEFPWATSPDPFSYAHRSPHRASHPLHWRSKGSSRSSGITKETRSKSREFFLSLPCPTTSIATSSLFLHRTCPCLLHFPNPSILSTSNPTVAASLIGHIPLPGARSHLPLHPRIISNPRKRERSHQYGSIYYITHPHISHNGYRGYSTQHHRPGGQGRCS